MILDAYETQSFKTCSQEALYGLPRMQLTTGYALNHKGVYEERKQRPSYFKTHKKEMGKGHGTLDLDAEKGQRHKRMTQKSIAVLTFQKDEHSREVCML